MERFGWTLLIKSVISQFLSFLCSDTSESPVLAILFKEELELKPNTMARCSDTLFDSCSLKRILDSSRIRL
jgi:hypothetical protein